MCKTAFVGAPFRNSRSPGSRLRVGFLIAIAALTTFGSLAHGQSSDGLRMRTIGEPPTPLIKMVASIFASKSDIAYAGQVLRDRITDACGYVGETAIKAYLVELVAANKNVLFDDEAGDTPLTDAMQLNWPACISAKSRVANVISGGITQLIKAELGLDYDPSAPRWLSFVDALCTLNPGKVNCAASKTDPVLQVGKIRLPFDWSLLEARLAPGVDQNSALAGLRVAVAAAAKPVGPSPQPFFDSKDLEAALPSQVSSAAPVTCLSSAGQVSLPLGNGSESLDLTRLAALAAEYKAYARTLPKQGSAAITIVDTGVDRDSGGIKSRLYASSGLPDSSNAGVESPGTPYKASEFGLLPEADIWKPSDLPPGHGTEVASIALGQTPILEAITKMPGKLPPVRFFRALHIGEFAGGKNVVDESSLERAFTFIGDRLDGGVATSDERNVINVSIAATFSNSISAAKARLLALRHSALVVAAAGNDYGTIVGDHASDPSAKSVFPAMFGGKNSVAGSFLISVGAARASGRERTDASNVSRDNVDLFAWGECAKVVEVGGTTTERAGTSFAAPWVTLTAALLMQGPLFFPHPANIKGRIQSAVRSSAGFWNISESGGILDPMRTIDMMVDQLTVNTDDGPVMIRGLVDYAHSASPCQQVPAIGNLARFEMRDNTVWFRSRTYFTRLSNTDLRDPPIVPLQSCAQPNGSGQVKVYLDKDFGRLAKGESFAPESYKIANILDYVARLNENKPQDDVKSLLRNNDTRCIYLRTTKALGRLAAADDALLTGCPAP